MSEWTSALEADSKVPAAESVKSTVAALGDTHAGADSIVRAYADAYQPVPDPNPTTIETKTKSKMSADEKRKEAEERKASQQRGLAAVIDFLEAKERSGMLNEDAKIVLIDKPALALRFAQTLTTQAQLVSTHKGPTPSVVLD